MNELVQSGEAKGTIFILDTLKKFTNLMDKTLASEFGNTARSYVTAGGTLIALALVNKKKGEDGHSIHAGTSDIKDDCDCVYMVEKMGSDPLSLGRTVSFINEKSRGNVVPQVSFKYNSIQSQEYQALLDSVERMGKKALAIECKRSAVTLGHVKDKEIMDSILEHIGSGKHNKGELIELVRKDTFATKSKISKVLKRWEGNDFEADHRWCVAKGEKNTKFYKPKVDA
jgi:hypothetical protein